MARANKPSGNRIDPMGNPEKKRRYGYIAKKSKVLIICEGKETEVNYFESLKLDSPLLLDVKVCGVGKDPKNLFKKAKSEIKDAKNKEEPFETVWIVFDRDDFTEDNFITTINEAKKIGISPIYSVEAFELWYLLHFDYVNTGVGRNDYKAKLSERLHTIYKKNDIFTYGRIKNLMPTAIANAKRLHESYNPTHKPYDDNPCTTVYKLVCYLLGME